MKNSDQDKIVQLSLLVKYAFCEAAGEQDPDEWMKSDSRKQLAEIIGDVFANPREVRETARIMSASNP